ncbi:class I SAM-dependent methyltransferase [Actinomycetospora straminea]|uniref:Class I SAM-dependent methyltransferase n=1 Tax=Actinomycetospora straminea TaxID=663607 RepID=A0ABP9E356_9PSEU|nr:class I SAM-dependent methyltransferase [Actinomycetospora straminea]MDD7931141.1 class I SAM-dependent methyltransferase [Actinomycetospora straminea]
MPFWTEHVVPRIVDVALGGADVRALRERAVARARGEVVELGFGSGPTLPLYPAAVTSVRAVEPSAVARRRGSRRIAAAGIPVEYVGLDGAYLDLPDASADTVVSTFTLCTIPDVDRALREVRRVLRPGGQLLFLEHGLSPEPRTARWQHRLDGLQQRLAGGCHLTRPVDRLVRDAGLTVTDVAHPSLRAPGPMSYLYLGAATP